MLSLSPKSHTREKCYKLVGYLLDHPFHPNNKGKKRPGQTSSRFGQSTNKSSHAMQASVEPSVVNSSENTSLSTQMEVLQNQMTSLMQCFNNKAQSTAIPAASHSQSV